MDEADLTDERYTRQVCTVRIIVIALLIGQLSFLGLTLFLVHGAGQYPEPRDFPVLSYTAIGFIAMMLVAWYFLPSHIATRNVASIADGTWTPPRSSRSTWAQEQVPPEEMYRTDTDKLLAVFQITSIIGWSLMESSGFMGTLAYLIEHQPFALGVTAVALILQAITFPTRMRINEWLEAQQTRMQQLRQVSSKNRE